MIKFKIQAESNIPVSKQLFDQIQFAIASRQYPPGHRLPSTRQLAQITGLHRNTISKVYRQLEKVGLVQCLAGSGIYVKTIGSQSSHKLDSSLQTKYPEAPKIIQQSLDKLLKQGCNLTDARKLFLSEIDWRLKCSALILVAVPEADIGVGKLMVSELEQALLIPVELVLIEELTDSLEKASSATVVTSRYFIQQVLDLVSPQSIRVILLDIYDYSKELELIKDLPQDSCLGIVSLSAGILKGAEILIHSLRGEEIIVMTAQLNEQHKLKALIRSSYIIISDPASYPTVKKTCWEIRESFIRPPQIIRTNNYISEKSINLLKRELGINN